MPRAKLNAEAVTQAAYALVDADGVGALTLTRLAADLGVASPSLYKHVASLGELIARVTTLALRYLTDEITAAALGRAGRQALVGVAEQYRRCATEHPGLYALTQAAPTPGCAVQEKECLRAVEVFAALVRSYGVADDLSTPAIRFVRAALHGFVDIETRGGFQMPVSVDASFAVLIEAVDASLATLGSKRDS